MNVQQQPRSGFRPVYPADIGLCEGALRPVEPAARLARTPAGSLPERRIPDRDIIPVGRRKGPPAGSGEDAQPRPSGPRPGERAGRQLRSGRLARVLVVALAAEVLLSGAFLVTVRWNKSRGIEIPVTASERTVIT